MTMPGRQRPHFTTDQYRILSIELVDGAGRAARIFRLGEPAARDATPLRFGEPFRLRVDYECLLAELPDCSCGLAAALTRQSDMEPVMYFNTNYPHSDAEMLDYDAAEHRAYIGRRGRIEAQVARLQIKPERYLLTVGLLPNRPIHHEFYELHYMQYPVAVLADGTELPAAFYPLVSVAHQVREAAAEPVTPAMVEAGIAALRRQPGTGRTAEDEAVQAVYRAMRAAAAAAAEPPGE